MGTEGQSSFGSLYKVACLLLFAIGLVTTFPLVVYVFMMGIPSLVGFGMLSMLLTGAVLIAVGWALMHLAFHWTSTAPTSFVAPTVLGLIGVALVCLDRFGSRAGY